MTDHTPVRKLTQTQRDILNDDNVAWMGWDGTGLPVIGTPDGPQAITPRGHLVSPLGTTTERTP